MFRVTGFERTAEWMSGKKEFVKRIMTNHCLGILMISGLLLGSVCAQQPSTSQSGLGGQTTVSNLIPTQAKLDLKGQAQTLQELPTKNGSLEWMKALAPVLAAFIAVVGVVLTAWVTMRRGRLDARYEYASQIFQFRLHQLQDFYAPALLLIEQSRTVYEKLLWTIRHERKQLKLDGFRLLDHIHSLKKEPEFKPLVERILAIGEQLTELISSKAGYIEGGLAPTYIDYLAHFEILRATSEQELTWEQKEGWHEFGYYPRMLNREIREGFKVVLSHVEKYLTAGDQTISQLLNQRGVDLNKYRRQLLANLAYYEQNAETYAKNFDAFDLTAIRQRFLETMKPVSSPSGSNGRGRILDAGCGTGRDSYEFIKQGYAVTAFDPSPALLRFCRRKIREAEKDESTREVAKASRTYEMTFDEILFRNEFEGVWAAASLLHVPPSFMYETLRNLFRALKPGGILYFSLKYGVGEYERDARFYTYYGKKAILKLMQEIPEADVRSVWLSDKFGKDLLDDEQAAAWDQESSGDYDRSLWLNVLAMKRAR